MNLSECLSTADISTLRKITDHYGLSCSKHSKLSLLQELLYTFRSASFLDPAIARWQAGRDEAMIRLCLETRNRFSAEELRGIFQSCGGESVIQAAMEEGWLFPSTRYHGRLFYYIPEEIHAAMRRHLVARFLQNLATDREGPLLYQDEGFALVRDLDVFLEYVRHHTVPLTTGGSMYKRNLTQVLELLEIREEPLQGGWRFGYGRRFHDYPDRLALLYDYAYSAKLVIEGEDGYLHAAEDLEDWYGLTELERARSLMRFYINLYRRPIARLPQVVHLIGHAAMDWLQCDQTLAALADLVTPYYYDDRAQVWRVRILKMLMHLGLIRIGQDDAGSEWFQITKLGQQLITPDALPATPDQTRERQRILIVQPNFDIVVTGDQPMVTAELAAFTDLRQAGAIRIYRLTEASARRGLASGGRVSAWLAFLNQHAQTPVPGNVERTLLEWGRAQDQPMAGGTSLTS
ncbi:helicase-associated domain-containing protein [Alicyclobacillus sp.]|uniref:helicase-associated domain-containing protein n=1 Tax=Alicyclobacillus sp. TaxID=61169 RepID=UPI0025C555E0|nr:helicase-associated domain-containing protein [Alicyclobacillus sp.]MCL6515543.1 helicase-associated domain-containing protein [Alicyclobacillus sp.]